MKKLAVIGGGIAGVSAAHLLHDKYEVTLFEKNNHMGGNNHSAQITSRGNIVKVPMGVITFPRADLFIHTIAYAKKFKLPLVQKTIAHAFTLNQELEYCLTHHPRVPHDLSFKRLKREVSDVWYLLFKFKNCSKVDDLKLGDLIKLGQISENCAKYFLAPFAALYLSMPYPAIFDLPAHIIADWWSKYCLPVNSLFMFSYIKGGNHQIIDAFVEHSQLKLMQGVKINNIKRNSENIELHYDGISEVFDKVVLAIRPDEALALLDNPTATETSLLKQFDVGSVVTTLHKNPQYSYFGALTANVCEEKGKDPYVVSTLGQNTCFGYDLEEEHYVSIHQPGLLPIPDEQIMFQEELKIPLPTKKSIDALDKIDSLNDNNLNTYFCGSYFGKYFYHEDAINSAIKVANILTSGAAKV